MGYLAKGSRGYSACKIRQRQLTPPGDLEGRGGPFHARDATAHGLVNMPWPNPRSFSKHPTLIHKEDPCTRLQVQRETREA